jgi:cytochrome c oxidase subunit 4
MNANESGKLRILPTRTYLSVGFALLILTAITVTISFIPLGGWNAVVAVGIASLKALLVALFFMHLLYDRKIYLIIFLVALIFLTVFIVLTMFDVLRRGDINEIGKYPIEKETVIYSKSASNPEIPGAMKTSPVIESQAGK